MADLIFLGIFWILTGKTTLLFHWKVFTKLSPNLELVASGFFGQSVFFGQSKNIIYLNSISLLRTPQINYVCVGPPLL